MLRGSDGEAAEGVEQVAVDGLVVFDGLHEGHVDDFVVFDADHHVALVVEQGVDGGSSHARGQDAVVGRGRAATLQVAQNRHTHVVLRILLLHALGDAHSSTGDGAFGHEHDR